MKKLLPLLLAAQLALVPVLASAQVVAGGSQVKVADGADVAQGATTATACATDNGACSVTALVKRTNQRLSSVLAKQPALGTAGSASTDVITVQGISGGTNLNVACVTGCSSSGGDASAANQSTQITAANLSNTNLGGVTETAPASDTASSGLNGRLQRIAQRLTALITAIGSPFQAGGALGAGTAIIGKVGIDQTTPGITNGVQVNAALPAGSNVIGHVVADSGSTTAVTQATASSLNATVVGTGTFVVQNTAATVASENHLGEVGGNQISPTFAQTVTASSAYATGNAVGGLITVTGATRVSGTAGAAGTSGLLQSLAIDIKSTQTGQIDALVFNANPSGSTCTDKTAVSVAAADFNKLIGVVHVTDWTSAGTPSIGQTQSVAMPYVLSSATSLYVCLVTRSTPTFTATTDVSATFGLIRN